MTWGNVVEEGEDDTTAIEVIIKGAPTLRITKIVEGTKEDPQKVYEGERGVGYKWDLVVISLAVDIVWKAAKEEGQEIDK